jgi:hypothetical protein
MKTNQNVTINFRNYGEITIPKGTLLTNKTAMGISTEHHFVDEFDWIPDDQKILRSDAIYYGIDIPKEYVQHTNDVSDE